MTIGAMTTKIMALRHAGTCAGCGAALAAGTTAQWDPGRRTVRCLGCAGVADTLSDAPERAGVSARREHDRRHDRRASRLDECFGRWSPVVKFVFKDPQSIEAWARGSAGERKLAEGLARRVGHRSVILHDRRIPGSRANIDHLVVAASGVWIVDAKTYAGEVERRGQRLFVGGRDKSSMVGGMTRQVDAVLGALSGLEVPVHAALCFVDARWPLFFAKPFQIGGVWVTWGRRLAELIAEPGQLSGSAVLDVGTRLHEALRPA